MDDLKLAQEYWTALDTLEALIFDGHTTRKDVISDLDKLIAASYE